MKIVRLLSLVAVVALLFCSCTGDDAPQTTMQKIQARWTYEKDISYDLFFGTGHWDTTYADPGDYMDFRTDGKMYRLYDSERDTSVYSLIGNNKIVFTYTWGSSDTFDIHMLNDHQFQLYVYQYIGPGDTHEHTVYLTR